MANGLTPTEHRITQALRRASSCGALCDELADKLGMTPGGIRAHLSRLADKGITQADHAHRLGWWRLIDEGRKLARQG